MAALTSLGRLGLDPAEIDAVVVSHLHGDHFGGLPLLLLDAAMRGRFRPLTIAGPARTRERVEQTLRIFGWESAGVDAAVFVHLVPAVPVTVAGCEVTAFELSHDLLTMPTGLRVASAGATIGYSGDAGWSEALVAIARGADLFICAVLVIRDSGPHIPGPQDPARAARPTGLQPHSPDASRSDLIACATE
jgi:ribonuclease BN (tRNA processing enzyme)